MLTEATNLKGTRSLETNLLKDKIMRPQLIQRATEIGWDGFTGQRIFSANIVQW